MAAPLLETARLRLRLFTPEDATALGHIDAAACGKRDRAHVALSPGEAQSRGRHLVHRFLEQWDAYGFGVWAVVDKAHDTLRGYCGLQYVPGTAEVELLYLLDSSVWGRGLATEAAAASVRYGREVVGLRRLVARVAASNGASRRVLEKVGLVCERVSGDGAQDIACYATPAGHHIDPVGETHPVDGGGGVHHGGVGEMRAGHTGRMTRAVASAYRGQGRVWVVDPPPHGIDMQRSQRRVCGLIEKSQPLGQGRYIKQRSKAAEYADERPCLSSDTRTADVTPRA